MTSNMVDLSPVMSFGDAMIVLVNVQCQFSLDTLVLIVCATFPEAQQDEIPTRRISFIFSFF